MAEFKEDFITHLNYVTCLRKISDGLKVSCNLRLNHQIERSALLAKKRTLIRLIKRNLDAEFKEICRNHDFAEVCVPWIAVKSYYLLFNLFLILGYFLGNGNSYFKLSHEKILRDMKLRLRNKDLVFDKGVLNKVYNTWDVYKFKFPAGYNIRLSRAILKDRYHQLLKKLALYKIEDLQRRKNIKDWRTKLAREKRDKYLKSNDTNVCDFFYWYRIKANYRDLEFLDKDISCEQYCDFYENYYHLTANFYSAFKDLVNNMAKHKLTTGVYINF